MSKNIYLLLGVLTGAVGAITLFSVMTFTSYWFVRTILLT